MNLRNKVKRIVSYENMDSLCSELERKKHYFLLQPTVITNIFLDSDNLNTIHILSRNSHICYGLSLTEYLGIPNNTLQDMPFSTYTWYSGQPSFHYVHEHTYSPQDKG